jgi:hypothetical protein
LTAFVRATYGDQMRHLGSLVLALAVALSATAGCSSDTSLGSVDGAAGGAVVGDAPGGMAGDGGLTGIIPGMALGKFCHQLTHNGQPATLTLEVGDKIHFTTFTAITNTCQPLSGMPCTSVPVGLVELRIKEGAVLLAIREVILHDGEAYLFQPGINSGDGSLGIGGGLLAQGRCMGLQLFAPDAGTDADPIDGGLD